MVHLIVTEPPPVPRAGSVLARGSITPCCGRSNHANPISALRSTGPGTGVIETVFPPQNLSAAEVVVVVPVSPVDSSINNTTEEPVACAPRERVVCAFVSALFSVC